MVPLYSNLSVPRLRERTVEGNLCCPRVSKQSFHLAMGNEKQVQWMVAKSISHHFETKVEATTFVGVYKGNRTILGFRRCLQDFVHPQYDTAIT